LELEIAVYETDPAGGISSVVMIDKFLLLGPIILPLTEEFLKN
jgi:hypothetical protein